MTTIELLTAPPATKDAAALLERLERLRACHWQELNNEGCYLLTLVRRAWEREQRNREIDQMIAASECAAFHHPSQYDEATRRGCCL